MLDVDSAAVGVREGDDLHARIHLRDLLQPLVARAARLNRNRREVKTINELQDMTLPSADSCRWNRSQHGKNDDELNKIESQSIYTERTYPSSTSIVKLDGTHSSSRDTNASLSVLTEHESSEVWSSAVLLASRTLLGGEENATVL